MSIYDVKFFPSIKINVMIVLCEYICDKSSIYQNACWSYHCWRLTTSSIFLLILRVRIIQFMVIFSQLEPDGDTCIKLLFLCSVFYTIVIFLVVFALSVIPLFPSSDYPFGWFKTCLTAYISSMCCQHIKVITLYSISE